MMFFDNLNKVCKSKNTTPTAVVKSLGLSSSKVTAWKNGSLPKEEIIERLAEYLCVDKAVFFDAAPSTTYPVEKIERILKLMEQHGVTASRLSTEAGLPSSAITEWKKGKAKPSLEALQKISNYFNVSIDYLAGNDTNISAPIVEKDEIIYNRNGEVIKKKFTKEQMDYLEKFIRSISNDESEL